jgi:virginiamycin B lyase
VIKRICSPLFGLVVLMIFVSYGASDGKISGTVKGPNGAPLKGIFVQARSMAVNNLTVSVLSDKEGHYQIEHLLPGDYQVSVKAADYQSDPPTGMKVAAGASLNLALKRKKVGWSNLAPYQAYQLLPEKPGKQQFIKCMNHHGFPLQERQTPEGWEGIVNYMKALRHELGEPGSQKETELDEALAYVSAVLTVDGPLPASPADIPGFSKVQRQFSDDAMKIVYVDYDLPASSGPRIPVRGDVGGPSDYHPGMPMQFPWSAAPDKDGNLWIPYRLLASKIARLNPNTGEVKEFKAPNQGVAAIHSAVPTADGTVWFNETGPNKIAKWDPRTQVITEYQAAPQPDENGKLVHGTKNTILVDPKGYIWSSGQPLTRLDPETGKFKYFLDAPQSSYDVKADKEGNVWFTADVVSAIGRIDAKTEKVTTYPTPTPKSYPRRMKIDTDGIIWFGEYDGGKIGRFDPKTKAFKEYTLPGPRATPYPLGIDANHQIWYSGRDRDVLGLLDPKTGHVIEYPMPYSFASMRDFITDSQGRMWFAVPQANKVGYFYLASNTAGQ